MNQLSHIGTDHRPSMVDVGDKPQSHRLAEATGHIALTPETIAQIGENKMKKGNVLITAELAGVQAAKQTSTLIPLCHPLLLTDIQVKATLTGTGVSVATQVKCTGQTGVEMEALTAASVALLTIYDMCKAVDKTMEISGITLLNKTKQDV